jgi:hypothetical protein
VTETLPQDQFNQRLRALVSSLSNTTSSCSTVLLVYNWERTRAALHTACGADATAGWTIGVPSERELHARLRRPAPPGVYTLDVAELVLLVAADLTVDPRHARAHNLAHHARLLDVPYDTACSTPDKAKYVRNGASSATAPDMSQDARPLVAGARGGQHHLER